MPLVAMVGVIDRLFNASKRRQNPTRIPYSCHAQLGRSGNKGWPMGGLKTVRGMARSMLQCSTLTMIHTKTLPLSGRVKPGLSTIAEYGTRELSKFDICAPEYWISLKGEINEHLNIFEVFLRYLSTLKATHPTPNNQPLRCRLYRLQPKHCRGFVQPAKCLSRLLLVL